MAGQIIARILCEYMDAIVLLLALTMIVSVLGPGTVMIMMMIMMMWFYANGYYLREMIPGS